MPTKNRPTFKPSPRPDIKPTNPRYRLPENPEASEAGYCPHGTYVGGCGIDWMCHDCEMGISDAEYVDGLWFANVRRLKEAATLTLIDWNEAMKNYSYSARTAHWITQMWLNADPNGSRGEYHAYKAIEAYNRLIELGFTHEELMADARKRAERAAR